jgi:ABC-type branched-subunit amino acid transport system substrate-binding protein
MTSANKKGGETMKENRIQGAILALGLAALLLVTACAPPTTLPPGEKVVEVGDLPLLTGGGGTADQPCFLAAQDYVRYFNEERHIPGVTIKLVWRDCVTQQAGFLSGYHMLLERKVPVVYSNYATPLEGLKSELEKDQMPFLTGGGTAIMLYPPGWIFSDASTQGEAATAVLDYFIQSWRGERPPKLQFFILDSPWGQAVSEEAGKYAESIGFEVLPLEVCSHVVIDATTQLIRIREREADLVYIQHIITGAGPIMKDVERLGLHDKMQFAGTDSVLGGSLISMAPVAAEGFLSPKALPWIDETEIPGIKTMIDRQLEYRGTVYERPEYVGGWFDEAIVCEAVKRALDEVGYENIDGASVKRALESMKDFDVDGMGKITYGPENRRGDRYWAVYQVQSGKIVRVSDHREVPILGS